MSRTFMIVLEDSGTCDLPAVMDLQGEEMIFGNALPEASMLLDDIAEDLGITLLSAFIHEEDFEEEEVEPSWHDPQQGLETVQKLFSYILGHPEVDKSPEGEWWILWDLRATELILREAMQRKTRFYFEEL